MRRKALLWFLFLLPNFSILAQSVQTGDIAFTSVNFNCSNSYTFFTNSNGTWSFVALREMPAGTVLFFTNRGFNANTNNFHPRNPDQDAVISLTLNTDLPSGTVVVWNETTTSVGITSGSFNVGTTAFSQRTQFSDNGMIFRTENAGDGGDQILCYTTPDNTFDNATRTFISGLHFGRSSLVSGDNREAMAADNGWHRRFLTEDNEHSMLPAGLTNAVNCISLANPGDPIYSGYQYTGTTTGTASELLAAISQITNWSNSGDINNIGSSSIPNLAPPTGPFTVTGALPVRLGDFSATTNNRNIHLQWHTLQEQNNDRFVIEHAENSADYQIMATIQGRGNSETPVYYESFLRNAAPGAHVFRLWQYDQDGRKTNLGTKTIRIQEDNLAVEMITASVVEGNITLQLNGKPGLNPIIQVVNMDGKILIRKPVSGRRMDIDLSGVPAGMYLLHYADDQNKTVKKIFVR